MLDGDGGDGPRARSGDDFVYKTLPSNVLYAPLAVVARSMVHGNIPVCGETHTQLHELHNQIINK
jgi:hypothetical protein